MKAPPLGRHFAGLSVGVATIDVRKWQQRMRDRGWDIVVDGIFGCESRSVAKAFQTEKGLAVDGIVGLETWRASWELPIT